MPISTRLVIVGGLLACAAFSQDAPEFRSHVELVAIPCTVVDAVGSPVHDLMREEFRVFDNDVPRIVSYLSHDDDQPVTLGILIDDSDSQHDLVNEHRRTVFELLQRMHRPSDSAFMISIGEDVRLYRDLTLTEIEPFGEPCPTRQGISVCGGSPLWNTLYDAARLKLRGVRGNKALLLLTDGFDTGSVRTWREAAAAAQKADPSSMRSNIAAARAAPTRRSFTGSLRKRQVLGSLPRRVISDRSSRGWRPTSGGGMWSDSVRRR